LLFQLTSAIAGRKTSIGPIRLSKFPPFILTTERMSDLICDHFKVALWHNFTLWLDAKIIVYFLSLIVLYFIMIDFFHPFQMDNNNSCLSGLFLTSPLRLEGGSYSDPQPFILTICFERKDIDRPLSWSDFYPFLLPPWTFFLPPPTIPDCHLPIVHPPSRPNPQCVPSSGEIISRGSDRIGLPRCREGKEFSPGLAQIS